MTNYFNYTVFTSLILLSSCMSIQEKHHYQNFDFEKTSALLSKGNNTIKGSAVIRRAGGGVVTCAGNEVTMVPATPYSDESILAIYGNNKKGFNKSMANKVIFKNEDSRYRSLIKEEICDAQGFFKFRNVADGDFYIVASVTWVIGRSLVDSLMPEGGILMQRVSVSGGEEKEIVLSP